MRLFVHVASIKLWQAKLFSTYKQLCQSFSTKSVPRNRVYFETYGCQMNHSDTEIVKSLLHEAGYQEASTIHQSDIVLLLTCAIRESAEQKIWARLRSLRLLSHRLHLNLKIGVLGCMAGHLKERLLEKHHVPHPNQTALFGADFVCGPDAYRDVPRLIEDAQADIHGANVALSLEETYADITPVRRCAHWSDVRPSPSALLSVMRGCNNMCTYCIVPFVRGRERSRPLKSILDEARTLFEEGVREITLLGQNVNSYCDGSEQSNGTSIDDHQVHLTPGFHTIYRMKGGGWHFVDLLDQLSRISPELRIRFTSPHPKNFPIQVIQLIAERKNICSQLHLPAQSGSATVLERMRRGYSPSAYMKLVETVQQMIPNVAITSDFIAGFCGETEADHEDSVHLIQRVGYSYTFCYPYSMREKTRAYHRLTDDVPEDVKKRRFLELKVAGREASLRYNEAQVGRIQLILTEGVSRRSLNDIFGRNDANIKIVCPKNFSQEGSGAVITLEPGDYVAVKIVSATSQTLHGLPIAKCSAEEFHQRYTDVELSNPGQLSAIDCT